MATWLTKIDVERVLIVDRGRDVILCDRWVVGPEGGTLLVRMSGEDAMAIAKTDFNLLVGLFNRRTKFDVIGITDEEFEALGRAIDALRSSSCGKPAEVKRGATIVK